jgi:hypothetical protein
MGGGRDERWARREGVRRERGTRKRCCSPGQSGLQWTNRLNGGKATSWMRGKDRGGRGLGEREIRGEGEGRGEEGGEEREGEEEGMGERAEEGREGLIITIIII